MKDNLFILQDAQTFKAYLGDLRVHDGDDEYWNAFTESDKFAKNFVDILVDYTLANSILPLPDLSHVDSGDVAEMAQTVKLGVGPAFKRILYYNLTTWDALVIACIDYAEKEQKQKSHDLFSKKIGEMTGFEFQQFLKEMNLNIFK